MHLTSYRERGIVRRFRASGVSVWTSVGAELLVTLALTTVGALLVAGSMRVVYSNRVPATQSAFAQRACFFLPGCLARLGAAA